MVVEWFSLRGVLSGLFFVIVVVFFLAILVSILGVRKAVGFGDDWEVSVVVLWFVGGI